MAKKITIGLLFFIILFGMLFFVACDDITPKRIKIYEMQTSFIVGEEFTIGKDAIINLQYDDTNKNKFYTSQDFEAKNSTLTNNKITIDFSKFKKDTVGTYQITVFYSELKNPDEIAVKYNVAVLPQENFWTTQPRISNWVYNDEHLKPVAKAQYGATTNITFEFKRKYALSTTYSTDYPTAAGDYVMRAKVTGVANTKDLVSEVEFQILKKQLPSPTIHSKPYCNNYIKADIPDSNLYTIVKNQAGISKGEYEVILKLTDFNNYKWQDSNNEFLSLVFRIV